MRQRTIVYFLHFLPVLAAFAQQPSRRPRAPEIGIDKTVEILRKYGVIPR